MFTGGDAVTSNLLLKTLGLSVSLQPLALSFVNLPGFAVLLCQGQGDAAPMVSVPKLLLYSDVCSSKDGIKGSALTGAGFCKCSLQEDASTAGHSPGSPASARLTWPGLSQPEMISVVFSNHRGIFALWRVQSPPLELAQPLSVHNILWRGARAPRWVVCEETSVSGLVLDSPPAAFICCCLVAAPSRLLLTSSAVGASLLWPGKGFCS